MPGMHWPAGERDISVERRPLHNLHDASVLHDKLNAMPALEPTVVNTSLCCVKVAQSSSMSAQLILRILMDTGASGNFVSPRVLQQLKLSSEPAAAKPRLADNSETGIIGKAKLTIRLQHCCWALFYDWLVPGLPWCLG